MGDAVGREIKLRQLFVQPNRRPKGTRDQTGTCDCSNTWCARELVLAQHGIQLQRYWLCRDRDALEGKAVRVQFFKRAVKRGVVSGDGDWHVQFHIRALRSLICRRASSKGSRENGLDKWGIRESWGKQGTVSRQEKTRWRPRCAVRVCVCERVVLDTAHYVAFCKIHPRFSGNFPRINSRSATSRAEKGGKKKHGPFVLLLLTWSHTF